MNSVVLYRIIFLSILANATILAPSPLVGEKKE